VGAAGTAGRGGIGEGTVDVLMVMEDMTTDNYVLSLGHVSPSVAADVPTRGTWCRAAEAARRRRRSIREELGERRELLSSRQKQNFASLLRSSDTTWSFTVQG